MPAYRAMRPPRLRLAPLVGLVAAFHALAPVLARAQEPTAPPGDRGVTTAATAVPNVTLPVVRKDEGAAYPRQALDEGFRSPTEPPVLPLGDWPK